MGSTLSTSSDHCCGTEATRTTPPPSRDELKLSIGYISPHTVPLPSPLSPTASPSRATKSPMLEVDIDADGRIVIAPDTAPPVSCLVDPVKRASSPKRSTKRVRFDTKRIFEERLKTDLPLACSTSHLVLHRRYSVGGSGEALRLRQHTDYVIVDDKEPVSPVRPSVLLRLQEERDKIHNEWAHWAKGFKVPAKFTSPPRQTTRPVTSVPTLELDTTARDEPPILEPPSPRKAKRKDSLDGSFRSVPRAVAKRNSSAFLRHV
ncbi:hypothetical protein SDRG_07076 [Saprolegnia diclina VS20]|uniref:Uncharacterized protein n=1 Tax=Saprolegnia diclina (strain VS20) TaxID=1156394 RepID=T0QBT4_SAPDV|nr:hypothetical protein SDRG_07076 [Saprolegnia diclina VS20]EQC35364.1 hypothetical protein SDRG_07076 [Saprolegnia diclina VS20]|eukprot:XP_008611114.1 hypothetical protein SDRG_07076 [Saprolegnia diclina VS20]